MAVPLLQPNDDVAGLGMLGDIAEGLLDNPIQMGRQVRREQDGCGRGTECCLNACPSLEILMKGR